jgi:hypothetical protein
LGVIQKKKPFIRFAQRAGLFHDPDWGYSKEKALHSLRSFAGFIFPFAFECKHSTQRKNKARSALRLTGLFLSSGWPDSN